MDMCGNTGKRLVWGRGNAGAGNRAVRPSDALSREMSACSACAGDYEDPDHTAWPTEEERAEAAEGQEASELPDRVPKEEG